MEQEKISTEDLLHLTKMVFSIKELRMQLEIAQLSMNNFIGTLSTKYDLRDGDGIDNENGNIVRKAE